ncbi:hypothetical protein ACE1TI_16315 [Alteribacillus sp. JSM 102045]|uniref:hypothetical protein n=1 Tax=Alteribacillus sp. JSM 102045 TaxID=1562101 RepID=UPI0035C25C40
MYYHPSHWISPPPPIYEPKMRMENTPSQNMMPENNMDSMMDMMQRHMQVTNEIKRKVDQIDERLRRMEEKMRR